MIIKTNSQIDRLFKSESEEDLILGAYLFLKLNDSEEFKVYLEQISDFKVILRAEVHARHQGIYFRYNKITLFLNRFGNCIAKVPSSDTRRRKPKIIYESQ